MAEGQGRSSGQGVKLLYIRDYLRTNTNKDNPKNASKICKYLATKGISAKPKTIYNDIFRLQIDSNYIAVVLTILGYSLNDTIVIYDRVRENRKLYPDMEISELVNMSISKVSIRNVVTSVTTFLAIITIVVVSEIYGLTSLRTLAIPMAFGVVSGAVSSLFIAGRLWVIWKNYKAKKARKKAK